jgi:hypothetical protein
MTGLAQFAPLAQEAAAALERRAAQYPALVAAGKIAADDAARELRVWRAIMEDWHWVVTLERGDAGPATLAEKIEALEESLRRTERALHKAFAACDVRVRRQWGEGMAIASIVDFFGEEARPFLEAWDRHWAIADLLAWYRRDLPGSDRPGIAHFVDRHVAMAGRRKAA